MTRDALYILGYNQALKNFLAVKALYFVVDKYEGKKRDDKRTDASEHSIRVCRMLVMLGITDDATLAAALLHDTVEDKKATIQEIKKLFGERVSYLVDLLTRKEGMTREEYVVQVESDPDACLIKAADRLCNVDDMTEVFALERLIRYVQETENQIFPMMKRARRRYPEYSKALIICRDAMKPVIKASHVIIGLYEKLFSVRSENEKLKKKTKHLAEKNKALKKDNSELQKKGEDYERRIQSFMKEIRQLKSKCGLL